MTTKAQKVPKGGKDVVIPNNGVALGQYINMADVLRMIGQVGADICVIRRSMAAEVASGLLFAQPMGAEHLGDQEFWEGIREQTFSPEVESALVGLSRNHCLHQLLRAGQIIDAMRQPLPAPCGSCVPTPDANATA
jgi:hypothetical protein